MKSLHFALFTFLQKRIWKNQLDTKFANPLKQLKLTAFRS